jgi:hypothetical protein
MSDMPITKREREELADKIRHLDPDPQTGRVEIPSKELDEVAQAFAEMDKNRQQTLDEHPVQQFVDIHTRSGTPDDTTICGVHTVRITLADLRSLLDMVR